MKITYTGSQPTLEIDHDGTTLRVKTGDTIEVTEALGAELCARKDFKRAAPEPQTPNPKPQTPTLP